MNEEDRITYEEFMIMFKNAPRVAYTLYDKAEDEIDKYKQVIDKIKKIMNTTPDTNYSYDYVILKNEIYKVLEEIE